MSFTFAFNFNLSVVGCGCLSRFTYLNIVGQVGHAVWKAKETLEGEALLEEKH